MVVFALHPAGCSADADQGAEKMQTETEHKYTNNLINESSPYLLQHAHNPVDWYPWGDEALDKAKAEDKPIFLSIGYSACHWCHVMEEESFENPIIAGILNEHFISIKVDREQRPDLDQIYMAATQTMTGGGGWPMSVFMTPDLKPFYAGTYFPPEDGRGRPGFGRLLNELAKAYKNDRAKVEEVSGQLVDALSNSFLKSYGTADLNETTVDDAIRGLMTNFDRHNGGFGGAPKFPHPTDLSFMLKYAVGKNNSDILEAVELTLKKMAYGGIYDQLGGGFHRYSVDAEWQVPHFEKMLYDNALLTVIYAQAYQATGNELYRRIVTGTLDFVLREMSYRDGGFYSSLDADSDGEEGIFYIWKKDDIDNLLGDKARLFEEYYNVNSGGNFENNTNILNLTDQSIHKAESLIPKKSEINQQLSRAKQILFDERSKRNRPFTDDKILTSWNGMMISGFAWGYKITRDQKYLDAALNSAQFIKDNLYKDNVLIHSYREGRVSSGQFLEDYAFLSNGLVDLYEVSHDYEWIRFGINLVEKADDLFADTSGNLYLSPAGMEDHFMRPKDISDGALPACGSVLINAALRLADISGRKEIEDAAQKYLTAVSGNISGAPYGMVSAVSAFHYMISDRIQLVVVGDENESYLNTIYNNYLPNSILIVSQNGDENIPLLEGKSIPGKTLVYLCKDYTCKLPAETISMLKEQLKSL